MIRRVPGPRQPLQNIAWLVGERAVRAIATATVLGIVARYLQPAGFGQLNFALSLYLMFAAAANLGLEGLVVNELVLRPTQAGAVLGTAFRLRLAAGTVVTGLLAATSWLLPALRPDAPLISIVALGLLVQPVEVLDLWFQRHLDSRRTVVARFLGVMAGATLKLWLVARGAPLSAFAWALVADVVFIACGLAWVGSRSPYPTGPWRWDAAIARDLWRRGAPLALSGLMVAFALRLDQILVRAWLGERVTGLYFASTRLIDIAVFVGAAISISFFPSLSASHSRNREEYFARLQTLFSLLSGLGWAVVLACNLGGPWIVRLLYGPAYAEAAPILAIQSWACLIILNAMARWQHIILSASTPINLATAGLHLVCLYGLAHPFVAHGGAPGMAVALVVANFVSGIATTFVFPSLRPCAGMQLRGLLILFAPARWPGLLRALRT
jgi:PST family polysaccharide transporter